MPKPDKLNILGQDYLSRQELAYQLNKTVRSLHAWERAHTGPAVTHIGESPYYAAETVRAWLADQEKRGWPDVPAKDAASSNGEA